MNPLQKYTLTIIILILSGCAVIPTGHLKKQFGKPTIQERELDTLPEGYIDFWSEVKPILDKRCVSCHACYDAPCQLKLTAPEGIDRGTNTNKIYHNTRLYQADLTRLFEDAQTTQQWRNKSFSPVLNEYGSTIVANKAGSPMYQLLQLKEDHPLPNNKKLAEETFSLELNRQETCPKPREVRRYQQKHPLWGMPYALPGLASHEQSILKQWIEQGGMYTKRQDINKKDKAAILEWEHFFNQDSIKSQLVSRYIYEHLFLANIYFDKNNLSFFKLVRSKTPPGKPVNQIATRYPYDDPGVKRVYYRLIPSLETRTVKAHLPYLLDSHRKKRWQSLFFDTPYNIDKLPNHRIKIAANPFNIFQEIPIKSRYKFLLDEAQFTIMNFIKGASCRGQTAVNVIRDHFWVFFINPEHDKYDELKGIQQVLIEDLELPSVQGDTLYIISNWMKYAKKEKSFIHLRDRFLANNFSKSDPITLDLIWDGDKHNKNAALTIFRNFDNATVKQGLIGNAPQTAWVIGYHLLERIHYLLVAGYDVYGNIGHQLLSRLHMDFLRMEGESSFLLFLPQQDRNKERENWYREADQILKAYLINPRFEHDSEPDIHYVTEHPKIELFSLLKQKLAHALSEENDIQTIKDKSLLSQLQILASFSGENSALLPEVTFVEISDTNNESEFITILRNNAHLNISTIFNEDKKLLPSENTLTIARGLVGAYPNALMKVDRMFIASFVNQVMLMKTEKDYERLLDRFGIRRTHPDFWQQSDKLHIALEKENPVSFGFLDYNRLENR